MTALNDVLGEVVGMGYPSAKNNDRELFGIQEALTKLWTASLHKDKEEIGKRIANLLIGTMINAHRFGIDDIEHYFRKRMGEYELELKIQK